MKNIVLVCSAGMSTSLLVTKMEKAAMARGDEIRVTAIPSNQLEAVIDQFDLVLMGPQVRFQRAAIEKIVEGRTGGPVPVAVVDMADYGRMDGEAVYSFALKLLGE